MIIQIEKIELNVHKFKQRYEDLGYEIPKSRVIFVEYSHLMPNSQKMISCECDDCGLKFERNYQSLYGQKNIRCKPCGRKEIGKTMNYKTPAKLASVRRGAKHHNYKPDKKEFKLYKSVVYYYTRIADISKLENSDKVRGLSGDVYQLDHMYSLKDGYENGVPAYLIGSVHNLRIVPRKENRNKWHNSNISIEKLIHFEKIDADSRHTLINSLNTEESILANLSGLDNKSIAQAFSNINPLASKSLSKAALSAAGKKGAAQGKINKSGIFGMTHDERVFHSTISGNKCVTNKSGIFSGTDEEKFQRNSENGKKGGATHKGSKKYNDGKKEYAYTAKKQSILPFEDFIKLNPEYVKGRLPISKKSHIRENSSQI